MQPSKEYAMDLLAAMLCEGLNFFRFAQHHSSDSSAASVFRLAADARAALLHDLHNAGVIGDPVRERPWQLDDMELSYSALRETYDSEHPERSAGDLFRRERELRGLVAQALNESLDGKARQPLQGFLPSQRRAAALLARLSRSVSMSV